jgi:hypothetical protein
MEEKQKMKNLLSQKSKISKEIEEIQNNCLHPDKTIKFVNDDKGGTLKPMWVCDVCEKVLNIPTEKELNDWLGK